MSAIEWKRSKARNFLYDYDKVYQSVPRDTMIYIRENVSCGDDPEEFILFLVNGLGFSGEEIRDDVLTEELGYDDSEADEIMISILGANYEEDYP